MFDILIEKTEKGFFFMGLFFWAALTSAVTSFCRLPFDLSR